MRVKELAAFIREREAIRVRKESGAPRPWTKDPILNKYRFCNVHREHDRVSRWLREHYYPHFTNSNEKGVFVEDAWFAAVVARLLNQPDSLRAVMNVIVPFQPIEFERTLHQRKQQGMRNFNAAYIVSTNGIAMDKVEYIVRRVLTPLWDARKQFHKERNSLESMHGMLMNFDGMGSFIAAQVVADLKYMPPLNDAGDWHTFASSGPGSRRGMNRVLERSATDSIREAYWREALAQLLSAKEIKPFDLHAQDLQNCLCEFDKYERARLGEGTPKQIYKEVDNVSQ